MTRASRMAGALLPLALGVGALRTAAHPPASGDAPPGHVPAGDLFRTADACIACHNAVVLPTGEDLSIGSDWRSSMMANAARDPYWQAGVRREVMDHPGARAAIEDKCSTCHMPMARTTAHLGGGVGEVFANLPVGASAEPLAELAADGVSCTVCHQITERGLGRPSSFTGGFVIDTAHAAGERAVYGPFETDEGRARLMRSATGFTPTEGPHVQSSELCASCHTLYTHALDEAGDEVGELPEQVPYLEWLHSDYRDQQSCQSCHMPVVAGEVPVTGVLGRPRPDVSRHVFRGGNFFMQRMLNRYRDELGVEALPGELDLAARRTLEHLQSRSAAVAVEAVRREEGHVAFDVVVENLAGHKLPTAYPSRRAWLRVVVRDPAGRTLFESGALRPDGSIVGNDGDDDAGRWEPHYERIEAPDQVQVYEAVMEHHRGGPTTGLLSAVGYLKDNRVLPRGFDKATADDDIAVRGAAASDADFLGGSDRVAFRVAAPRGAGPLEVTAELWYQTVAFRWARNLADYDAPETRRFVGWYDAMAGGSAAVLARGAAAAP